MDLLDTADPAWLDEFLAEDLKATVPPARVEASFPYNASSPTFTNSPRMSPHMEYKAPIRTDEARYNPTNEHESVLKRFKFIKSMKKLSIPKIAEMLQIPKSGLQRFNSGKDKNFGYLNRVKDWIYHTSNREGLRCFENNQRSETMTMMQGKPKQTLQNGRDSIRGGPYRENSMSYMYGDISSSSYQPQPFPRTPGQTDLQNKQQKIMNSPGYAMNNRLSPYPEQQLVGLHQTNSYKNMTNVNRAHNYPVNGRKWNHMQSLEVLSQMLKRDTNKLLHKGIDSAIQEYLDQSKALRDKMKAEPHTRENDYFYKKQGKLLLNRLTTICGDDVVNRATSVLSDLKSKRSYKPGRVGSSVDLQKLTSLTKTWNHACSCKDLECRFPNCRKIKPAVTHQLRLKDEKRRKGNPEIGCTIRNCEHCLLYMKLKKFATSTRSLASTRQYSSSTPSNHRMASQPKGQGYEDYAARSFSPQQPASTGRKEQRIIEYSPSYHNSNSYNSTSSDRQRYSHSQSYSNQRQGQKQGNSGSQIFNQQNNATSHTQNVNNTNVNYNTYNIHTNPVMKKETSVDAGAEDMASLVEVLGEDRKHNVNINVNVSLYGNAQKRRQETQTFGGGVKKPRPASSGSGYQQQQDKQPVYDQKDQPNKPFNRSSSLFSATPIDPSSYTPDVDEDLADLFPETLSTNAQIAPNDQEANNGRRVLCVVCHGKERDALFKPCNHCCACMNCALKLRSCPMCRAPVDSTSHIFLS